MSLMWHETNLLVQVVLETLGEGPNSDAGFPPSGTAGTSGRHSLTSAGSLPVVGSGEKFSSAPELQGEDLLRAVSILHWV